MHIHQRFGLRALHRFDSSLLLISRNSYNKIEIEFKECE